MIVVERTNTENPNFVSLVAALDKDLAITDGDEHDFYDQYNKLDDIKYAIVAMDNGLAIGCGAIKQLDDHSMEVKRMYVRPESRGKGVASLVLKNLEHWAQELGYARCVLETGLKQPAAIRLYNKNNYMQISNYGQYKGVQNSVCFEKRF